MFRGEHSLGTPRLPTTRLIPFGRLIDLFGFCRVANALITQRYLWTLRCRAPYPAKRALHTQRSLFHPCGRRLVLVRHQHKVRMTSRAQSCCGASVLHSPQRLIRTGSACLRPLELIIPLRPRIRSTHRRLRQIVAVCRFARAPYRLMSSAGRSNRAGFERVILRRPDYSIECSTRPHRLRSFGRSRLVLSASPR